MPTIKRIQFTYGMHGSVRVVYISFVRDRELINFLKSRTAARWSVADKKWYLPADQFVLNDFFQIFRGKAFLDYSGLKTKIAPIGSQPSNKPFRKKVACSEDKTLSSDTREKIEVFRRWMLYKRYSASTIKTYTFSLTVFFRFTAPKPLCEIGNQDIINYVNEHIISNKLSYTYQNQLVNSVKLFFREIMKSRIEVDKLERPRRGFKLPNVLSKAEVRMLLEAPINMKHRTMLSLIYACGLRRGELLNIRPEHVDSRRGLLIIKNAKGRKDRVVPLSKKLVAMLRDYYKAYRPAVWLFEGQKTGMQYSEQSIQSVLKQAVRKAGIKRSVTLHWLRHSYATHLLEGGTDLRYIQALLGHKSSRTTELYTHVSTKSVQQIRSPFDDL